MPKPKRDPDPTELEIYGPNGNDGLAAKNRAPERRGDSTPPRSPKVYSITILKKDHREHRG
jgi:hypothetical protein